MRKRAGFAALFGALAFVSLSQAGDLPSMNSAAISALQHRLADAGCYAGASDGIASPATADAAKACPSQEPILRIETGMHTTLVRRFAVDANCRIGATGADDKTLRLWSLPDGKL